MLGSGAMTGFARSMLPATASTRFDGEMRSFLKVVVDFFVADLASIGADIFRRFSLLRGRGLLCGRLRGRRLRGGRLREYREA